MIKELSIKEIYQLLIDQNIYKERGYVSFDFLGIQHKKFVKDAFGYMFQEWLNAWMKKNNIFFKTQSNTQEPPDLFIKKNNNKEGLVEIKTFTNSPSFDVSSWDAYLNLLYDKPYHIDADYLIFEYIEDLNGFKIKKIYLRKIWQIIGETTSHAGTKNEIKWPISIQYKNNTIVNIRPNTSELKKEKGHKKDRIKLLKDIQTTINLYNKSPEKYKNDKWLTKVKVNYKKFKGVDL